MGGRRIAVVGGGIAGLVAAVQIAREGRSCLLLEGAPGLGGRARTRLLDGFHFNQGPHALYVAGAFPNMLREWGVDVRGGSPDLSAAIGISDGASHPLPISRKAMTWLDAESRGALAAQFARIASGDYDGRGEPVSSVTRALPPGARRAIEALARVSSYAHAPDLLDAKAAFDQLRLSFAGVVYPDGGWQPIVDGLAKVAATSGADLRTSHRVTSVSKVEDGWRIEVPPYAPEQADAVILALPPSEAGAIAHDVKTLKSAVTKAKPARIVGLDLALGAGPRPLVHFALGMAGPIYFSIHSSVARLAPAGGVLAHIARYLSPDEIPPADFETELERLADSLLPRNWRSFEIRRQRHIGMVVANDLPTWQTHGRRTRGHFEDVPGLYLAGDWIGDEGMLVDAAAASGRAAARQALSFLAALPPC